MDSEELRQRLLAAARVCPPNEAVPHAFEKRVMARLARQPAAEGWAVWSQVLWRAVAPCVLITFCLGVWAYFSAEKGSDHETCAAELEATVCAPFDLLGDDW
jgi:hypothetical protein